MGAESKVASAPPPPLSFLRFNVKDFHVNVKETVGLKEKQAVISLAWKCEHVSLQVEDNLLCTTLCASVENSLFHGTLREVP